MAKLLDVPCTVALCDAQQMAKGLCWKHYCRLRKHGDVLRNDRKAEGIERFWRFVRKDSSGCWLWVGRLTEHGYGTWDARPGHSSVAHRFAYSVLVEPIAPDDDAHHVCGVRACVNPSHIEVVDAVRHRREHNRRLWSIQDPDVLLDVKARIAAGVPVARIAREMGFERTAIRNAKKGMYDALLEGRA